MNGRTPGLTAILAVVWLFLLIIAAVGCGRAGVGGTTGETPTATEEQTRQETTSSGTTPEEATAREAPFTEVPAMSGGVEGAAYGIRGVEFGEGEGYERAVVSFGSGGEPAARVPAWSLSSPTGEGYARITFPDVDDTATTDGSFGGSVMDGYYVVRAPEEGLFVDLFATGAFLYRVTELPDPGRLAIDYKAASVPLEIPLPARSARTVLFSPREGEVMAGGGPLEVAGYSRSFEASNTVLLKDANGGVISRTTALSNDWAETWGYFETSLDVPPSEGPWTLLVGSESARDGSLQGVEVQIGYGTGRR